MLGIRLSCLFGSPLSGEMAMVRARRVFLIRGPGTVRFIPSCAESPLR